MNERLVRKAKELKTVGARELIKGAGHYPFFRNETVDHFGGLEKAREYIDNNIGVLIVYFHGRALDPAEIINDTTEGNGRNKPIVEPIAIDRTHPALQWICNQAGIDPVQVVTPDAATRAAKNGNKNVENRDGLSDFTKRAAENLKNGNWVFAPITATRSPYLEVGGGVLPLLLADLKRKKVDNFAIHFAASEIPGLQYYGKRGLPLRKILFQKHIVHHGETLMLDEFMQGVETNNIEGEHAKDRRRRVASTIEKLAYDKLAPIVPLNALGPRTLFTL